MSAVALTPRGPYSLAAAPRFLEGFTPARHERGHGGVPRPAFPSDDGRFAVTAAVRRSGVRDPAVAGLLRELPGIGPGGVRACRGERAGGQVLEAADGQVTGAAEDVVGYRTPSSRAPHCRPSAR
ncbi:hypothetical protein GCM10009654_23540 [Streptomyces hebeiensis]|uniref:Uncharacterized protein n=1 Tax=Streptomyces hebeiensis TaxID=229486 RepID=A0ABN1UVD2_9ACTN